MKRSHLILTQIPTVLCGVLGVSLLCISMPHLLSAYYSHDSYQVEYQWSQGEVVLTEKVDSALLNLEEAASYGVDLSGNASLRAKLLTSATDTVPNDALAEAIQFIQTAISRRPLDAYLWTNLALLEYRSGGYSPNVEAALERAYRYGPVEFDLVASRNVITFREWRRLPDTLIRLAKRDVAFMARSAPLAGQVLAYLPKEKSGQFLSLLDEQGADIAASQRHANWFKRQNGL